jgi:hypothetical protein
MNYSSGHTLAVDFWTEKFERSQGTLILSLALICLVSEPSDEPTIKTLKFLLQLLD